VGYGFGEVLVDGAVWGWDEPEGKAWVARFEGGLGGHDREVWFGG
jgi:hypothetical protein